MQQEETPNNKQKKHTIKGFKQYCRSVGAIAPQPTEAERVDTVNFTVMLGALNTPMHLKNIDIRHDLADIKEYLRQYIVTNYGKKPSFIFLSFMNCRNIEHYMIRSGMLFLNQVEDRKRIKVHGVPLLSSDDLKDNELIIT